MSAIGSRRPSAMSAQFHRRFFKKQLSSHSDFCTINTYFIERFRMCGQRGGSTDISYSHATGLGCDYPIARADAVARAHRRDLHEAEDVDFFRVADQCDF